MSKKPILFTLGMLVSTSVYASDFTGLISLVYFSVIIIPALVIHLIACLRYYRKGRYQSKSFAVKHFEVAMLLPFLGLFLMGIDYYLGYGGGDYHHDDLVFGLTLYTVLILVFSLPYFIYRIQKRKNYRS
jgi:phosphatidylglycerophosphate synthase